MELININGKGYQFVIGYGKSNDLRKSLNDLTQKVFGFNFEQWYQDGYWKNQYIPYSLIDRDKIVSNIEVFGYDKLHNLIKSPNNFVSVFGITENQMRSKWIEYIKKTIYWHNFSNLYEVLSAHANFPYSDNWNYSLRSSCGCLEMNCT
ncbi:hypothetical protein [Desulfosporosinus sp. SB140]|uniref:hypothetical protein n=1 Tax=Desulfosporosinus paludis TaxID=3115649 RepID=UPI00388F826B